MGRRVSLMGHSRRSRRQRLGWSEKSNHDDGASHQYALANLLACRIIIKEMRVVGRNRSLDFATCCQDQIRIDDPNIASPDSNREKLLVAERLLYHLGGLERFGRRALQPGERDQRELRRPQGASRI